MATQILEANAKPSAQYRFVDGLVAASPLRCPVQLPVVVKRFPREGSRSRDRSNQSYMNPPDGRPPPQRARSKAATCSHARGPCTRRRSAFMADAEMASIIPGSIRDWLPCWQIRLYFFTRAHASCLLPLTARCYIHIFSGLAGPDGHQRVPVIRSGDGDGVDIFVFQELTNVDVGFGFGTPSFSTSRGAGQHACSSTSHERQCPLPLNGRIRGCGLCRRRRATPQIATRTRSFAAHDSA